jgi:long-subunit acyl-CoA synthetase (AMP-forming)
LAYEEMNQLCNQLARQLIMNGVKKQDTIAIYGHRSASMVWSVMSILKAGCIIILNF